MTPSLTELEQLAKAAETQRCIMEARLTGQTHLTRREQEEIYGEYENAIGRLNLAMPPAYILALLAVVRAAKELDDGLRCGPGDGYIATGRDCHALNDALAALEKQT